ncbi:uncharacterized protein [Palaemon carinicauda]|uniref:uncharacterized protein n=1 Tax=Palaemon carinicauda TaxID=392227 RepID=UPI0035B5B915
MARLVDLTVLFLACYYIYAEAWEAGCESWELQPNDNIRSFKFTSGMSVRIGPLKDPKYNYRIHLLQSGLTVYLLDFIITSHGLRLTFQRLFQPAIFLYDLKFKQEMMGLNFTKDREMWTLGVGFGNDLEFSHLVNISLDEVEAVQAFSQSKDPLDLHFCYPDCRRDTFSPSLQRTSIKFQLGMTLGISTNKDGWHSYPFRLNFKQSGRTSWTLEFKYLKGTCYLVFNYSVNQELLSFYLHNDEILTMSFYLGREGSILDIRKGEYHKALVLEEVSLKDIDEVTVLQEMATSRQILICPPNQTSDVAPPRVPRINSSRGAESQETCSCLVSTPLLYVMLSVCVLFLLALVIFIVQEFRQLLKKMKQSVDQENSQVAHEAARSLEQGHEKRDSSQRPMNNFNEYLAPKTSGRTSCVERSYVVRAGEEDHVYFEIRKSRPTK